MGHGNWSNDYFANRQSQRKATGQTAFVYDAQMQQTSYSARKCHDKLNPKVKTLRESRDSADHPNSLAIATIFDETGSMGSIPRTLQQKLGQLMTTLIRQGVTDPQVLFGASGDAMNSEVAPIQIGEWESDVRMDDDLGRIYLEGNGGGTGHETYELVIYYFARHACMDCYEKRGKKGYLFLIGDELPYDTVRADIIKHYIGDDVERDIKTADIVAEAQRKFHVFFIIPKGHDSYGHGHYDRLRDEWAKLLGGEHVIMLDKPEGVCEAIATTVGMLEDVVTLDQAMDHAKASGSTDLVLASVARALDPIARQHGALTAKASGNIPARTGRIRGIERL